MLSSLFSGAGFAELVYRIVAILIALAFHEWAHAYAAYRLGDPTARNLGRMTINPLAHVDPLGFLMLVLVRFGWAKPVPINPRNFAHPRKDEMIVSLAGVATNLLLAFVTMGLYYAVLLLFNVANTGLTQFMSTFFFINIGLFVFNLLPIPPLDGYRFWQCVLIRHIGPNVFSFLDRYGNFILIALLVSGLLTRIMTVPVNALVSGMNSIYFGLFGLLGLL